MKKVEEFFIEAERIINESLEKLKTESMSGEVKTEFVGASLFQLANLKRKFELEVLLVLKSNYPEISYSLEVILMNFEDANSNAFNDSEEDPYFTYLKDINTIKSEMIKALSGPAL
jgi:hypothetical protein